MMRKVFKQSGLLTLSGHESHSSGDYPLPYYSPDDNDLDLDIGTSCNCSQGLGLLCLNTGDYTVFYGDTKTKDIKSTINWYEQNIKTILPKQIAKLEEECRKLESEIDKLQRPGLFRRLSQSQQQKTSDEINLEIKQDKLKAKRKDLQRLQDQLKNKYPTELRKYQNALQLAQNQELGNATALFSEIWSQIPTTEELLQQQGKTYLDVVNPDDLEKFYNCHDTQLIAIKCIQELANPDLDITGRGDLFRFLKNATKILTEKDVQSARELILRKNLFDKYANPSANVMSPKQAIEFYKLTLDIFSKKENLSSDDKKWQESFINNAYIIRDNYAQYLADKTANGETVSPEDQSLLVEFDTILAYYSQENTINEPQPIDEKAIQDIITQQLGDADASKSFQFTSEFISNIISGSTISGIDGKLIQAYLTNLKQNGELTFAEYILLNQIEQTTQTDNPITTAEPPLEYIEHFDSNVISKSIENSLSSGNRSLINTALTLYEALKEKGENASDKQKDILQKITGAINNYKAKQSYQADLDTWLSKYSSDQIAERIKANLTTPQNETDTSKQSPKSLSEKFCLNLEIAEHDGTITEKQSEILNKIRTLLKDNDRPISKDYFRQISQDSNASEKQKVQTKIASMAQLYREQIQARDERTE